MNEVNERWVQDLIKAALEVVDPDEYRVSVMPKPTDDRGNYDPGTLTVWVESESEGRVFQVDTVVQPVAEEAVFTPVMMDQDDRWILNEMLTMFLQHPAAPLAPNATERMRNLQTRIALTDYED